VLQCVLQGGFAAAHCNTHHMIERWQERVGVFNSMAVCCSVLQCVAGRIHCSTLQRTATHRYKDGEKEWVYFIQWHGNDQTQKPAFPSGFSTIPKKKKS